MMKHNFGIIGLGKVGSAMLSLLREKGYKISWTVTSKKNMEIVAYETLPETPGNADVILITVPDMHISEVAKQIAERWRDRCKGKVFFHMSGQLSSDALSAIAGLGGEVASLHPIQSIADPSRAKNALLESYFTVEGSKNACATARDILSSITDRIIEIAKEDKTLYHAAAVMASNYVVSIAAHASDMLRTIGIGPGVLIPLLKGTVANIAANEKAALTGPVQRGDWSTVRAHIEAINKSFPDLLDLYKTMGVYTAKLAGRSWPEEFLFQQKVVGIEEISKKVETLRKHGSKIVFTNGCFDILHLGHISYLKKARALGDYLVIGLNSDTSVKRLKGEGRPINNQDARAAVMSALEMIDFVTIFDQDTPYELISAVKPDVLVKGGDWKPDQIVGGDIVKSYGGKVISLAFEDGFSTTSIIEKIKDR